jgi:predicted lipid-binding transport protein (Tim44 family)
MKTVCKTLALSIVLVVACGLIEAGLTTSYVEAKSFGGGKSFRMTPRPSPAPSYRPAPNQNSGSFGRGMAGGLLGGALGGLLFGSMFGMGGQGMGILPLLLLAGGAYFLFRKSARQSRPSSQSYQNYSQNQASNMFGGDVNRGAQPPPVPPADIGSGLVAEGLAQIREHDPGFDVKYFLEIASDVFFQVQAGWMRRDLPSYRHLLGDQLAGEYEQHFAEMRRKGEINKLESIAVRNVEVVEAGSDGREDFVTVLFTASLLDYIVNDKSGEVLSGSNSVPVKFQEKWTWARPVGTENWRLEGIAEA